MFGIDTDEVKNLIKNVSLEMKNTGLRRKTHKMGVTEDSIWQKKRLVDPKTEQ